MGTRRNPGTSPSSQVVVIVDVLSFTTCVEVATSYGATVFPFRSNDHTAAKAYVRSANAMIGGEHSLDAPLLSPSSLLSLQPESRLSSFAKRVRLFGFG